jgi:uncharacterized protein YjbI with pentapeptide repeats
MVGCDYAKTVECSRPKILAFWQWDASTSLMISESLNLEIWGRLIQDKPLDGLALGVKDGRIDLGGLELPEPSVVRRFQFKGVPMADIEPGAVLQGVKWRNLDFSDSTLNGLRLFGCEIANCRFGNCQLQDLRLWSTKTSDSSFRGANLRKAALGAVQDGRRNSFSNVDFTQTDLRQTAYTAASFDRCVFHHAKLEKIDFQTSTFSECQFEGELLRVLFYRRAFKGEAFPANEMIKVDFRRAKLRYVEFRGLSLERVLLPSDDDHVVIKNYPVALDRVIAALQQRSDLPSRKLVAYLGVLRKWAAPNQVQGVLNKEDLAEVAGMEGMNSVCELLRQQ